MSTERNLKIIKLRKEDGLTVTSIARRFGISPQRVTKIVGYTGTSFRAERTRQIVRNLTPEQRLAATARKPMFRCLPGIWMRTLSKYHHLFKSGNGAIGQAAERWISRKLDDMGLANQLMPLHHPFDILVVESGARIDVKYCGTPRRRNPTESQAWKFTTRGNRSRLDFYLMVLGSTGDCFVIPSKSIPQKMESLSFCWPSNTMNKCKWKPFLNAFNLLNP